MLRLAAFGSGLGSNFFALLQASKAKNYPGIFVVVISDIPESGIILKGLEADIPTYSILQKDKEPREIFDARVEEFLLLHRVDILVLAGYMRILSDSFVTRWQGRIVNIHPSLLPDYKGLHTHSRVLADKQLYHGTTVHEVIPELDAGPLIMQGKIPVLPTDTIESLQERVKELENTLYPLALKQWLQTKVSKGYTNDL